MSDTSDAGQPVPAPAGAASPDASGARRRYESVSEISPDSWEDATALGSSALIPAAAGTPEALRETPRAMEAYPATHTGLVEPPKPSPAPARPVAQSAAAPAPSAKPPFQRRETPLGIAPPPSGASVAPRPGAPLGVTAPPPVPSAPPRRETPLGVPIPPISTAPRVSQVPAVPAPPAAPAETAVRDPESLSPELQEQLFGILRAGLDASLAPALEQQKQLEQRVEGLAQLESRLAEASRRAAVAEERAAAAEQRAAAAEKRANTADALVSASVHPPVRSLGPPAVEIKASSPPAAQRTSVVPTSYGYVTQSAAKAQRPAIEAALERVGPIDVPDFGTRRKTGAILIAVLVAVFLAAVVAMILSYA